ncbi:iroquois homeobox 4 [Rhinolophus ferrumequinum]|uniref:Iroquois homeobox 4 n=1 Tax=Rhinolophus ferrumequinum TaxID=59479 RepID=A0A7J7Y5A6_RHIFE|nr:iroquois homeobox 4 [Rhinolophus ferrumequinum]
MSYPQFGYPYSSAPQFLMTTNSLSTCCESGGRTLADSGPAATAQAPVYCPVYESRLLATARHELNSAAALGVYGGPYGGSQSYGNYVTYGSEASAFYSLNSFDSKDAPGSAHAGLAPAAAAAAAAAYYPYEPTLGQYAYDSTPLARPSPGTAPWTAARGGRTPRARPPARSRPGCKNTARTRTPPRARRSCWPLSPR